MNRIHDGAGPSDAELETILRSLRVRAPVDLEERTLVEVGLLDAFATLPGPIGTLFVDWNGRGVSMVDLAGDEVAFVRRLTSVTGRPARRVETVPEALRSRIERRLAGDRKAQVPRDWRSRGAFEQAV